VRLTWEQVRSWRAASLEDAGARLRAGADALLRLVDELDAMSATGQWFGQAADAAAADRRRILAKLEDLVAEVAAARRAVWEAGDAVAGIERAVVDLEQFAAERGLSVSGSGVVRDVVGLQQCYASAADQELALAERGRWVREGVAWVEQVLRKAGDVDADLRAACQSPEPVESPVDMILYPLCA
jgi:hypothetical protein